MHVNTGHLVTGDELERMRKGGHPVDDYTPLPPELEHDARRKLDGRGSAYVSATDPNPLSKWRREQLKAKRKAAKLARRRNRR